MMAVYRDKYILEGLDEIPEEMKRDLDLAYDICERLHDSSPCAMCGKCCHQPNINVRDEEIGGIASRLKMTEEEFIDEYLYKKDDLWLFRKTGRCRFLDKDNRCTIWNDRPMICGDFPYLVSKFMSRVYLSIVNGKPPDLTYMEDDWPCTPIIKDSINKMIREARRKRREIIRSV
ncbi:MAG: YkgJ family cysteine cluster protein [Methanomassiliicoccaceae archaeon]|nr:YkgJ family cysteine cluster protein [Methanomassiliicoccaceae archaeon]